MDDDVIFIDDERNAVVRRRPTVSRRPGRSVIVPRSRPVRTRTGAEFSEWYDGRPQVVVQQSARPLLGGFAVGEIIEMAAEVFAALQSLPAPPTAQGSLELDVENLVTYQEGLAKHAKRDEQLRTLGRTLGRFFR